MRGRELTTFIFIISYRHSKISTSPAIKLEIKVHNILVQDYNKTEWERSNNTVFIFIIFTFIISYRHSLYSTSTTIKSEIKVHSILVKHYKRTQWERENYTIFIFIIFIFNISYRHSKNSMSTVTQLDMKWNNNSRIKRTEWPFNFIFVM